MADLILEFFHAVNRRDLDAVEACFTDDYESLQPCFPSRNFSGPRQVREIYEALYKKYPDVKYEILSTVFSQPTEDGSVKGVVEVRLRDGEEKLDIQGVFIYEASKGKLTKGTIYMTPVQKNAGDIDSYVQQMLSYGS